MIRDRFEQRLVQFEGEWRRVANEIGVVITREDIPGIRQRIGHRLHGHRLDGAAGRDRKHDDE